MLVIEGFPAYQYFFGIGNLACLVSGVVGTNAAPIPSVLNDALGKDPCTNMNVGAWIKQVFTLDTHTFEGRKPPGIDLHDPYIGTAISIGVDDARIEAGLLFRYGEQNGFGDALPDGSFREALVVFGRGKRRGRCRCLQQGRCKKSEQKDFFSPHAALSVYLKLHQIYTRSTLYGNTFVAMIMFWLGVAVH